MGLDKYGPRLQKKAASVAEGRSHLFNLVSFAPRRRLQRGRGRRGGAGAAALTHDDARHLIRGIKIRVGVFETLHQPVQLPLGQPLRRMLAQSPVTATIFWPTKTAARNCGGSATGAE